MRLFSSNPAAVAAILLLAAALTLAACGGKPLHTSKWQDPADEIPPGPGLFSGEDGEFTVVED
jgi:hypothetical protein